MNQIYTHLCTAMCTLSLLSSIQVCVYLVHLQPSEFTNYYFTDNYVDYLFWNCVSFTHIHNYGLQWTEVFLLVMNITNFHVPKRPHNE